MFLEELKKFSKENWWVYLLLAIALIIVQQTWKWNMIEIILMFLWNFLGNLFIMVMQSEYTKKENTKWAIFHLLEFSTFMLIWLYWAIFLDMYQYLLWNILYWLAAINAFMNYVYKKDLVIANEKLFVLYNIVLFIIYLSFLNPTISWTVQAVWFALVTTSLVSLNDRFRYWLSFIWIIAIIVWSILWVYFSYFILEKLNGIDLWYLILTLTVFVYYCKLLPEYIKKKNK